MNFIVGNQIGASPHASLLGASGVAALLLPISGGWYSFTRSHAPASEKKKEASAEQATAASKSVAVLPFENLSSDQENACFADTKCEA